MVVLRRWSALMRRNLIYRKRHWIATIAEISLPVLCCYVLVLLKESAEQSDHFRPKVVPAHFTSDLEAIQPLSMTDYVKALQAKRVCLNKTVSKPDSATSTTDYDLHFHNANHSNFFISGMPDHGRNWQVPFIQCDSRHCQYHGEEAYQYCHYPKLGLAASTISDKGGMKRALDFQSYVYQRYPQLQNTSLPALQSSGDFIRIFQSNEALESYIQHPEYGTSSSREKLAIAIVFQGSDYYDYTLRVNSTTNNSPEWVGKRSGKTWRTTPDTNRMFASFARREMNACPQRSYGHPQSPLQFSCTGQYILNGLVTMQRFLHDWIMVDAGATDAGLFVAEHGVKFAPFPTKAFQEEGFYSILNGFLALFLTLGFLYPCAAMISYISQERETGQKEFLKMMSVKEWEIETSWFTTFLLSHIITAGLLAKVSKPLFAHSDSTLLWMFWQSTLLSFIAFSCFMPSIVSAKANSASRTVLISLLLFLAGYFMSQSVNAEDGSPFGLRVICLHPVAAFAYGLAEMGRLEDAGVGATWASFDSTDSSSGLTVLVSLQFLCFDCLLLTLLSWYFNRIIPDTEHGTKLPYSFPLQPSFWFQCLRTRHQSLQDQTTCQYAPANMDDDDIPIEPVSDSFRRQAQMGTSAELHNLRKVFPNQLGNSITAVDGLSLSLAQGQITALLGHNGSGKSTTINLLSGSMMPTDGFHVVAGKHSMTQMSEIREGLGICPQNNDSLFPKMTVEEHIRFFCRLKGVAAAEIEGEVDRLLGDTGLQEKRHTLSKYLSGGQKRKLCVAIAFCGDSNMIILDEPTSGMDPYSRRFIWNLLKQYRQGKIILLTTHFLDEADILADQIAILADGRLQCLGSPLFLKQAYDVGYKLTLEKKTHNQSRTALNTKGNFCSSSSGNRAPCTVTSIVREAVDDARLLADSGNEVSFHLPLGSVSRFGAMFRKLEREIKYGTLLSYGISMTTLEEVFQQIVAGRSNNSEKGSETLQGSALGKQEDESSAPPSGTRCPSELAIQAQLGPRQIFLQQVATLLRKRQINFSRDKKAWFYTTILPGLFVFAGFLALKYGDPERKLEPLPLDLSAYNQEPRTLRNSTNPIPYNNPGNSFKCQPGWCSYQVPVNQVKETNELYFLCGAEAYLLSHPNCSIDLSQRIMNRFNASEVTPIGSNARNLNESSHGILQSANKFRDSQYGAVYFTNEPNSTIDNGSSYSIKASAQCLQRSDHGYFLDNECQLYNGMGYVISYNFTALHIAPLFQKLTDEAIVREATKNDNFRISAAIHPLPNTYKESRFSKEDDVFNLWFMVILGFPIIAGYMGNFVLLERESKVKHLQTLAGVHPATYWISSFVWDTMNYQFVFWFTVLMMYAFDVDVFTTTERDAREGVLSLLFLFGPASASFAYCVSFLFTSASLCNTFIMTTGFLSGLGGPIAAYTLRLVGSDPDDPWDNLVHIATAIEYIGRFIPSFCLGKGLFYTINIGTFEMRASSQISVWDPLVLGDEVVALLAHSIGYLLLAVYLDSAKPSPDISIWWAYFVSFLTCNFRSSYYDPCAPNDTVDDSDILEEEDRVLSDDVNDDIIVMRQLSKVYQNGKVAVSNISLGIPEGECFGLLGVNGSGKTTTIGMLCSEFAPTSGEILLAGENIAINTTTLRSRLGYCPQFDALFENLTGREHVEMYAALKCMDPSQRAVVADKLLSDVGFSNFDKDRLSRYYSGGMKRKVSIACAMVSDPCITLFDEPSSGVDPVARREIWQILSDLTTNKKACSVLTTHSLDEAEALCSRIGIMSNGRLIAIGSAHGLKSKFGRGYQLELKVRTVVDVDDDFTAARDRIRAYRLPNSDIEAAHLQQSIHFDIEEACKSLDAIISDVSLSETLLSHNAEASVVFNDACSPEGVSLTDLSSFAATELRLHRLDAFICETFPGAVKKERHDLKVRYEISLEKTCLSDLFSSIEESKGALKLSEYGVSQTSLENVFNMLAADNSTTALNKDQ